MDGQGHDSLPARLPDHLREVTVVRRGGGVTGGLCLPGLDATQRGLDSDAAAGRSGEVLAVASELRITYRRACPGTVSSGGGEPRTSKSRPTHPSAPCECWNTHLLAQLAALSASVWFHTRAGAACLARNVLCSLRTASRMSDPSVEVGVAAAATEVVEALVDVGVVAGLVDCAVAALRRTRPMRRSESTFEKVSSAGEDATPAASHATHVGEAVDDT